jgi:uncharacterized membrane protein YdbT with pleckstrin-like domain
VAGYVDSNLIRGEQVVYRGRLSAWAFGGRIALGVLLIPIVVGLFILAGVWIFMKSAELAVTNKRVIVKFGWIRRDTIEMNLIRVESIQVDQTLWGRLCNYGSIQINGTGTSHAPIHGVADPLTFRRMFMEAQDQALQPSQAAVAPPLPR